MRRIARIVLLPASVLAIAALGATQHSVPARGGPGVSGPGFNPIPVGHRAPDFTAFAASGREVSLSQYRGKVVILDFWATWCGPCQVSMPGLEKIYRQVQGQGVVVLSLNTWDRKPDFQAWVKTNSGTAYHFDFARDPAEGDDAAIRKASIAKRLYKVIGIPTMYVIDRKGNVAASYIGSGNEDTLVKGLAKVGIRFHAAKPH